MLDDIFKNKNILILGGSGFVGKILLENFQKLGYTNISSPTRKKLDLLDAFATYNFISKLKPEIIIHLAARVGGIAANMNYSLEFLRENIIMTDNIFQSASKSNVKKIVLMGSSCMYPKNSKQPMKESYLNTGPLEPTNESYALSKIVSLNMAKNYYEKYGISCIFPICANIFGEGDNYNLQNSHVISALIKKFVDAKYKKKKIVEVWGDGSARREFIHVKDVSRAIIYFMKMYNDFRYFNLGLGEDLSIEELAYLIKDKIGFNGDILFNKEFPNGMNQKLMNNEFIKKSGFKCTISLDEGLNHAIKDYEKKIN